MPIYRGGAAYKSLHLINCKMFWLLAIVDAVVVPITQTNSTRVFCFTDEPNNVSFSSDAKCVSSCGYYEGQNTCCKDWVFSEDTIVRCYRSDNKTIEFGAIIMPTHSRKQSKQSELTCINKVGEHSTATSFYMKHAYLYAGHAERFNEFFNLRLIKLPADESEVECNMTKYTFSYSRPVHSEIMLILLIGLIVGTIMVYTWEKLPINRMSCNHDQT